MLSAGILHDTIADVEALDNPIWYALTGPHARFAEGSGLALRYPPEVSPFGAMPDVASPASWEALRALMGDGGAAVLFRREPLEPAGDWKEPLALPTLQMIATEPIGKPDDAFVRLGAEDADDVLALVERTRPGPFLRRTLELGTYLGQRENGRLIAMAGERLHLPGYTEISAVCTDEPARKRGLATRLIRAVAAGIEERSETPMLHVLAANHSAVRVYEALGFAARLTFEAAFVQPAS